MVALFISLAGGMYEALLVPAQPSATLATSAMDAVTARTGMCPRTERTLLFATAVTVA